MDTELQKQEKKEEGTKGLPIWEDLDLDLERGERYYRELMGEDDKPKK